MKGAQELGAAGVLVYSDPRDDGTVTVTNGYKAFVPVSHALAYPKNLRNDALVILMGQLEMQIQSREAAFSTLASILEIRQPLGILRTRTVLAQRAQTFR